MKAIVASDFPSLRSQHLNRTTFCFEGQEVTMISGPRLTLQLPFANTARDFGAIRLRRLVFLVKGGNGFPLNSRVSNGFYENLRFLAVFCEHLRSDML